MFIFQNQFSNQRSNFLLTRTWTLEYEGQEALTELEADIAVTMFVRHTGPTVAPKMWDNSAEQNGLKSTVLLSDNVLIVFFKKNIPFFNMTTAGCTVSNLRSSDHQGPDC